MKIVVMGGSFNPPTVAHLRLLEKAVNEINSDLGIFLPSSHSYVSKKMKKAGIEGQTLPEKVRFKMLCEMSKQDPRLTVDDLEFHATGKRYTYESLVDISEKYPGAEIYFLAGNDKVEIFPRWWRIDELLSSFNIIVCKRDGVDPRDAIEKDQFLSAHKDRFYIIDQPDGVEGISSTLVRQGIASNDPDWMKYCHSGAAEVLTEYNNRIAKFREEFSFLSNFYPCDVSYNKITYKNAEAAFQAQKTLDPDERLSFSNLSGAQSKSKGRSVLLRKDWDEIKLTVMEEIVRAKFTQNPNLAQMLSATGDRLIEEGNSWNDRYWGVDVKSGKGENHLGQILMKIRAEICSPASGNTQNQV
jgi:nicotinate (nicotinamide) nucleotide adenylyltransferase